MTARKHDRRRIAAEAFLSSRGRGECLPPKRPLSFRLRVGSKPLGQSGKNRAADAELRSPYPNPRAVADFIDRVADVQDVEAQSFWTMLALIFNLAKGANSMSYSIPA